MDLRYHPMRIASPDAYESAFSEASAAGVTAVAASLSPLASANSARIARLAAQSRLLTLYTRALYVQDGGLMSYGASFAAVGIAMARLVQRIFADSSRPHGLAVRWQSLHCGKSERDVGLRLGAAGQIWPANDRGCRKLPFTIGPGV